MFIDFKQFTDGSRPLQWFVYRFLLIFDDGIQISAGQTSYAGAREIDENHHANEFCQSKPHNTRVQKLHKGKKQNKKIQNMWNNK